MVCGGGRQGKAPKPQRTMFIGMNELAIREKNDEIGQCLLPLPLPCAAACAKAVPPSRPAGRTGLQTDVVYYGMPEETFPALVRRVNFTNTGKQAIKCVLPCPALPCPALPCPALPCPSLLLPHPPLPAAVCSAHVMRAHRLAALDGLAEIQPYGINGLCLHSHLFPSIHRCVTHVMC
jgi:hypothetical protein